LLIVGANWAEVTANATLQVLYELIGFSSAADG
jgi:hypothetical protein